MPSYTYDEPEDPQNIVLKPGDYDFVIAEVFKFETAEKTGNEYLPLKLHIKPKGTVFDNLVFSKKAKFRIDQLLKSIGKAPAPGTAVDFDDPSWLVGCKGRAKLKTEVYNGEERNKVAAYIFRKGEVQGHMVTAARPATTPAAAPADDDEIPF